MTSEGGLEAAIEAPYIYSALDSLAGRAKKWTELRAQGLEGRGALPAGASVEGLAGEAERAVKRVGSGGGGGGGGAGCQALLLLAI